MNSYSTWVIGVAKKLAPETFELMLRRAVTATAPAIAMVARICFELICLKILL